MGYVSPSPASLRRTQRPLVRWSRGLRTHARRRRAADSVRRSLQTELLDRIHSGVSSTDGALALVRLIQR